MVKLKTGYKKSEPIFCGTQLFVDLWLFILNNKQTEIEKIKVRFWIVPICYAPILLRWKFCKHRLYKWKRMKSVIENRDWMNYPFTYESYANFQIDSPLQSCANNQLNSENEEKTEKKDGTNLNKIN